jgi:hypothetical protein
MGDDTEKHCEKTKVGFTLCFDGNTAERLSEALTGRGRGDQLRSL